MNEEYGENMLTPIFGVHQWKGIDEHPLHLDNKFITIKKGGDLFENTKVIEKNKITTPYLNRKWYANLNTSSTYPRVSCSKRGSVMVAKRLGSTFNIESS